MKYDFFNKIFNFEFLTIVLCCLYNKPKTQWRTIIITKKKILPNYNSDAKATIIIIINEPTTEFVQCESVRAKYQFR